MRLHYETIIKDSNNGNKSSPLIILHGLFGSSRNWRSLGQQLNQRLQRPIYLADLRNHGASPRLAHHSHMIDYAKDILDTFSSSDMNEKPPHLMGHSLGGMVATLAALNSPRDHIIKSLIVVDWSDNWRNMKDRTIGQFLQAMQDVNNQNQNDFKTVRQSFLEIDPNPRVVDSLLLNLKRVKEDNYWKFELPIEIIREDLKSAYSDSQTDLSSYEKNSILENIPLTVIKGQLSQYVNDYGIGQFQRLFPKFHLHSIPNCGHWPHFEQPEEFLSAVEAHFERIEN